MGKYRRRHQLQRVMDILIPRRCVLCRQRIDRHSFCERCLALLPFVEDACARCGVPVVYHQPGGVLCPGCQARPPPYWLARAPLIYTFPVDSALKSLKFDRALHYAPAFGALLPPLARTFFADADALVPVPLHRRRHAWRGFNQATELCRPLVREIGLPVVGNVRRVRATLSQSGLAATERRRNLAGAFAVRGRFRPRRPLIVDDVVTTGATCAALARTLLEAGAEKVGVLAVARAVTTDAGDQAAANV